MRTGNPNSTPQTIPLTQSSRPNFVRINKEASLTSINDGKTILKNPIEINLTGTRAFIYTDSPLQNIKQEHEMKSKESSLKGPLYVGDKEKRAVYTVNLRVPFSAQLEDGVDLISDGKGLVEIQSKSGNQVLLDAKDAVEFLTTADAYKSSPETPTKNRDGAVILQMHSGIDKSPQSIDKAA